MHRPGRSTRHSATLLPFDVYIESGEFAVRKALRKVLDGLEPLGLDLEEASTVELVLAEALNNINEHAYPDPQAAGLIHIHCLHSADGLHIRINDEGYAMPDGQAPLGMAQNLDVPDSELPEGGFGWFLIRDLAKDVCYHRVGKQNQLDLRLAVAIPAPA
tara:strand:+ start:50641 stop:51120 length:480 start_codon:yes stop_codon:yes gene_type:complete